MSTRTIIELNHDYIAGARNLGDLHDLLRKLGTSEVTGDLNRAGGKPIVWNGNHAIRVLGQRHHSEPEWEQGTAPAEQPGGAELTKADTVALWHAVQWMDLCLREPARNEEEKAGLAAERERLKAAKRALRKVNAIRKEGRRA